MPTDPKHGQNIPAGQQIARTLAAFNRQIGNTIRAAITARRTVNFHAFITPMVESLLPLVRLHFARGRLNTYRRLRRLLAQRAAAKLEERKRKGMILATLTLKAAPPFVTASPPGSPGGIEIAFDVFLPQVELSLQRMVFQFVESTLATASVDAQRAYQLFREELRQGLSEGESLQSLNARVGQIFDDPIRAHRVAMTEASRAMHAGQEQAARESGIVKGLRWLASTDACEHCLAIDGKEVPLGQPFYVDPKGGPYASCTHPPLHPHCMCAVEEVIT